MTNETALLALLESREAEANAKAEWIAEWAATNRPLLLAGMLETDLSTLLAEVNHDQGLQLNQAMFLLMTEGDPAPLMQLTKQLMDAALAALAQAAWRSHLAALHDAMSEEQWEQYQHRSAA
ncbi:hypothetical protein ACB295_02510 [Aeromonas caviae]|uniref:hypothetical protein n=1 Tax=Aeromonas caviae TaxID=648 RepID=UPI001CC5E2FE|nr:hypothetical protein [Aeromonas caviae]GJA84664.1 hypothetical protein KAM356_07230 [Aeromonas caviae]GJA88698.1 hypothetical protein KAM357_06460 [Aeromonas caviae]GJB06010.1 hypothetical protein KAM361_06830 [Aeromonas caviae]GJB14500.1 hypothetical protein KAM363_05050 [Aeromonas caviae]GJB30273.1 hypothetical protein KAM366_34700 [Aeromonas caviae]